MGRKSFFKKAKDDIFSAYAGLVDQCLVIDREILYRRLNKLPVSSEDQARRFEAQLDRALKRKQERESYRPKVGFNGQLPIHQKLDEIESAIRLNQIIVVCGETGSGKTTQLAKLCLAMGQGAHGFIGHTQPRRLAARMIADRISEELNVPLGEVVGYKIRYSDKTSPRTFIKVMTDGILLAELQQDRWLERYDTLIIDEAHERSLNIDFLLGYLKQLSLRRPDLKIIITSATIDVERFSRFFENAPVIEVTGRTFPVEVRYRALDEKADNDDRDNEHEALLNAVDELSAHGNGDILIFLEGEREIFEATRYLQKQKLKDTDVLPLYSRLSSIRQNAIFMPHKRRHIVLATNVAETSLTIPGIRYVIDKGVARISRYSRRHKVQQLPIEKISRASADQRMGRCGRVSEGICIRLYSEEDYYSRQAYTDPEILRTNLAAVILQMKSLKLGDIQSFPFIEAPDTRYINDGLRLLNEIKATDSNEHLTRLGRQIARLPVDPRLGTILIAASDLSCVSEILTIVSVLSIQDPRDRPLDEQEKADQSHRQFADERSDFLSFLNLWNFIREQSVTLSHNQLRKLCRQNFLSYNKIREWMEVRKQLATQLRQIGITENRTRADYENIHTALINGLMGNVAMKNEDKSYTGARGLKIYLFPGSSQFSRLPKWIISAELIETSRLYARTVASINSHWLIKPASHITKSEYYEPYWDTQAEHVLAHERISLYGLPISAGHKVNYSKINRDECRTIFIRKALIEQRLKTLPKFLEHNREVIQDIRRLEKKARREDILDEQSLYDFYDQKIPVHIMDGHSLRKWYREQSREESTLLKLKPETIMYHGADEIRPELYPDYLQVYDNRLQIDYHFGSQSELDGCSLDVPVYLINQITQTTLDKLVPGLLPEKIDYLFRSLPKPFRRKLVPVPESARQCARVLQIGPGGLEASLRSYLRHFKGINVPEDCWHETPLPDYLRPIIRVMDSQGEIIEENRNLETLQNKLGGKVSHQLAEIDAKQNERSGILQWDFGDLAEYQDISINNTSVRTYPALVDCGDSVSIRLFDSAEIAGNEMYYGLLRLFQLEAGSEFRYLEKNLPRLADVDRFYASTGHSEDVKQALFDLISEAVFLENAGSLRTEAEFKARLETGKRQLISAAGDICKLVYNILKKHNDIKKMLENYSSQFNKSIIEDIEEHLSYLVYEEFISECHLSDLKHYPRYLEAIIKRLEKITYSPEKDGVKAEKIRFYWERYKVFEEAGSLPDESLHLLHEFWRMLEEYRVSLFAQELGTEFSVSEKKLDHLLHGLEKYINLKST